MVDTPELRQLLRTASADATVLLKNENNILPLSPDSLKDKLIAVIGPNAKVAYTSGGGSAVLLSTRTVSPLEGITEAAKEFDAKVEHHIGVTSTNYKYLPLISDYMKSEDPGALVEFWNETPTEDFLKTDADLTAERPNPVWETRTRSSSAFLTDGIVSLVNTTYRRLLKFPGR